VQLHDRSGDLTGCFRQLGLVLAAGGNDDVVRRHDARGRFNPIGAAAVPADPGYRDTGLYRQAEPSRIALQVIDELVPAHEGTRVLQAAFVSRENADAIRRVQRETVPSLGLPRVADVPPLQHRVFDPSFHQAITHPQARLTASDNNRVVVHDSAPLVI